MRMAKRARRRLMIKAGFFGEKYRLQSDFVVIGCPARFSAEDSSTI